MKTDASALEVMVAGRTFRLLGQKGIYWPDESTLLVADPHFGKDATFRYHKIPVPRGSTEGTLDRITQMIEDSGAEQVVVLGDMFHAQSSLSPDVVRSLDAFFEKHRAIEFVLTIGNHDAPAGQLPSRWGLREVAEYRLESVLMSHHPRELSGPDELLFCGHVHPAYGVGGMTDRLGNLPCFWLSRGVFVLPAVGQFTGTHRVRATANDRVWAVAEGQVVAIRG